ncbi:Acetoacetyl-CoA reductase [Pseudomonas mandelii JR-1]|uniref:Acetoacetyl-CoA reductase n=1 Tax=Pseudomonas mandelii JR-1 TaxID=1147786 RepID=A0A024E4E8_9PSED|nr:Acetoacetyl-CoA reductase [Pseudomonas mandelii JR-1]
MGDCSVLAGDAEVFGGDGLVSKGAMAGLVASGRRMAGNSGEK